MQTGKLDQVIELQSPVDSNTTGEIKKVYVPAATVWGEVIQPRGSAAFEAARMNARETIRVRLRYRYDVTTKWRLVWEGQHYNILQRDHSDRRKGYLWITCEVVGAV